MKRFLGYAAGLALVALVLSSAQAADKAPSGTIRVVDSAGKQTRYAVPEMKQVFLTFDEQDVEVICGNNKIVSPKAEGIALAEFDGRSMVLLIVKSGGSDQINDPPTTLLQLQRGTLRKIELHDGVKATTVRPEAGSRVFLESGRNRLLVVYDSLEAKDKGATAKPARTAARRETGNRAADEVSRTSPANKDGAKKDATHGAGDAKPQPGFDLAGLLDRVRAAAADDAWKRAGWSDKQLEERLAYLDKHVNIALQQVTDDRTYSLPVKFDDVKATDEEIVVDGLRDNSKTTSAFG